jgi:YfiH family protein
VLEAAVNKVLDHSICKAAQIKPADLMAWLGPAIGPDAFEVGTEVRAQFIAQDAQSEAAFKPQGDKWLGNLYQIATQRLNTLGISNVYGGDLCTFTDKDRFFSFRRDGDTGRMATLIWLA